VNEDRVEARKRKDRSAQDKGERDSHTDKVGVDLLRKAAREDAISDKL